MKNLLLLTTLAFSLVGCSLIPKKVEFFQDKVHKFPQPTAKQEEFQRQAAALAKQRAAQVVDEALKENASPYVLAPARDTEKLTDAVSTSLGPPINASTDVASVANGLNHAVAKHNNSVEAFAEKNDKDAGKKIEGTGLLQIPYFVYLGGIIALVFIGRLILKDILAVAAAANPGAAVAVGGLNIAGSVASKALKQIVMGGKDFLTWVENEVKDPALKAQITGAFIANHQTAQDEDVQTLVKVLKK